MSRVEEIRGRLEAATPVPWYFEPDWVSADGGRYVPNRVWTDSTCYSDGMFEGDETTLAGNISNEDADLIANAPADLAYLLERNAELEQIAKVNGGLYRSAEADVIRVDDAAVSARDELRTLILEYGNGSIISSADAILSAGWVSPDDVARIRAEALREAADGMDLGAKELPADKVWQKAYNYGIKASIEAVRRIADGVAP